MPKIQGESYATYYGRTHSAEALGLATPSRLPSNLGSTSGGSSQPTSTLRSSDAYVPGEATNRFLSQPPEPAPLQEVELQVHSDLAEDFRHGGWAPFRRRVQAALASMPGVSVRRQSAFRSCGCDAFVESRFLTGMRQAKEYRIRSTKCHDRFCVPCSNERARRIRKNLLDHMAPKENLSLITLTLAASDAPLRTCLDRITRCFRLLRNKPVWKKSIEGGCCIIETKIGKGSGQWHCHMHVVADAKYCDQKKLSEQWLAITGDSRIVDIRRVGAKTGAVQYVTKYVTKAADHSIVTSPKHLQESIRAFEGRRLVSTFGTWRGLKLSENNDEDEDVGCGGEWRPEGRLDAWLARAALNDLEALAVVRRLRGGIARPPPPV